MSGKFLFTIVGILVAIFALCNFDFRPSIIEGWNGMDGSRSVSVRKVFQDPKTGRSFSAGTDTVIDSLACGAAVGEGSDIDQQLGKLKAENYSGPSPYINPSGGNIKMKPASGSYTPQMIPSKNNVNPMMGSGEFFQAPPYFQSNLAPRFDNNGYGAYINYNRPDQQYL